MEILSFNKISKPVYEGGIDIDLKPKGKWLVEVRQTDGTIRRPFGDNWINNLFTTAFVDRFFNATYGGWFENFQPQFSFASLFYPTPTTNSWEYNPAIQIAAGSGSTPASNSDTQLETFVKRTGTAAVTGNNITQSSTTGDIVYVSKSVFSVETGSATYREAGVEFYNRWDLSAGQFVLLNRVVFPGNITLSTGEQLILTLAVTIPTLAVTGKTITIAAQNGVNVSGELRCIGTTTSMAGGTVSLAGAVSPDSSHPLLFSVRNAETRAGLNTDSTFPAFNTNTGTYTFATNMTTAAWSTYTNGNRYRDVLFTWANGNPASDTAFRSIRFTEDGVYVNTNGYQLLLDNEMTKETAATLEIGLRFSL